ncbi:LOW QUALITY PROTEIN: reverse transcriptase, partial [Phytophthora megakarya]
MPNLVILMAKSTSKSADYLRVFVDSGNNFVRQQRLPLLDFEEKHVPRSQLEERLATGAIVNIEKRVIHTRFANTGYLWKNFLSWTWMTKPYGRTLRTRNATESDGPINAADTPNGASEPPTETAARPVVSGRSAWSARALTTPGVVDRREVSGQRPDTTKKVSAVRRRGYPSVSTPGVDTHSMSKSREFSAVRRRGDNGVSTPGVDTHSISISRRYSAARRRGDDDASTPRVDATSCADSCKRPALKLGAVVQPGCTKQGTIKPGLMT